MNAFQTKCQAIKTKLAEIRYVPVLALNDVEVASQLATTLCKAGLPCAEVTFRTEQAAHVMAAMKKEQPNLLLGAGTVLSKQQVDEAIDAGVDFVVSPGLNPEVVEYCQSKTIPIFPGTNNPSQVEQAMALGLKVVKFFPAEASGGTAMLKSLQAVYPVDFMPTGGINGANAANYLELKNVFCVGGTWMVNSQKLANQQYDDIALEIQAL